VIQAPPVGSADIVELVVQSSPPVALLGTTQPRIGGFHEPRDPGRVAGACVLEIVPFGEARVGELADGLEHGEARLVAELRHNQRALDQGRKVGARGVGDSRRCRSRPTPDEDGEPCEDSLSSGSKQVVGPCEDGIERSVPRNCSSGIGQRIQSLPERGEDLRRRPRHRLRSSQLDGEGQPVELAAELGHRRQVTDGKAEVGSHRAGPVGEEHRRRCRQVIPCRHGQWPNRKPVLAVHAHAFPTRGEDVDVVGPEHDRGNELGCGGKHVLTVVEHQERTLGAEEVDDAFGQLFASVLFDAQRRRQGGRDLVRPSHTSELAQVHPIGIGVVRCRRDVQGDPRLAHAARPGEGDEPAPLEQPLDLGDLCITTDEGVARDADGGHERPGRLLVLQDRRLDGA
jgi:hypothetical protein